MSMLYEVTSVKPMAAIDRDLQEAAARHRFGVIVAHDLREMLKNKGVDLEIECRIYEVCNPQQAKKALDANGAVSTALPCRISVYGSHGRYTLATMLPTEMMKPFTDPSIAPVAQEVEDSLRQMMREAAGAAA